MKTYPSYLFLLFLLAGNVIRIGMQTLNAEAVSQVVASLEGKIVYCETEMWQVGKQLKRINVSAENRSISAYSTGINRLNAEVESGYSVRCVKD